MGGIKAWIKFIRTSQKLSKDDKKMCFFLLQDIEKWPKSLRRQCGLQRNKRKERQNQCLLTPEKTAKISASKQYQTAIKLVGKLGEMNPLPCCTRREYNIIKNVICFKIEIRNAKRSGVLAEIKL